MPKVVETIPRALAPASEAALAWLNARRHSDFHLTGVVDPDETEAQLARGEPLALQLVLCEADICLRETVRVELRNGGFEFSEVAAEEGHVPAELDPPAGTRSGWLDEQLAQYAFVVLLFYRGFW